MAFGVLGLTDRSRIHRESRKKVLPSSLNSIPLIDEKRLAIKRFLEITLVS